jgi:hypothetical protein
MTSEIYHLNNRTRDFKQKYFQLVQQIIKDPNCNNIRSPGETKSQTLQVKVDLPLRQNRHY